MALPRERKRAREGEKKEGRRPRRNRGSVFVAVWPAVAITTQ